MARPSSICLSCGPRAVRMVTELAPDYPSQYRRDLRGGQEAGHRDGGDAAQVGTPGRDRCGPAAGHDIGRACRDQAAEAENAGLRQAR